MRSTIAGVILIFASFVSQMLLLYGMMTFIHEGNDYNFDQRNVALAYMLFTGGACIACFLSGLFFLFLGRDKRPKLDKIDKSESQS